MYKTSPVDEKPAPEYTKTDENTPSAPLEPSFQKDSEDRPEHRTTPVPKHPDLLVLMLTPDPTTTHNTDSHADSPSTKPAAAPGPQADTITALFAHISAADTAAATHLIHNPGLPAISPDTPNSNGETTPLLASIRARSAPTARALLALGADPILAGRPHPAAAAWWDEDAAAAAAGAGVPKYFFLGMPRDVWRVVVWVGRAVPRTWDVLWRGLVDGLREVGGAVAYAAQRVFSALHSFVVAVVGFLKEARLRDLGHDLLVAMEAVLVKLPGTVWILLIQAPATIKRAVKAIFKNDWVRFFLAIAFGLVFMVPQTLWKLLESLWACLGRGVEELVSLINPKMVPSKRSRS